MAWPIMHLIFSPFLSPESLSAKTETCNQVRRQARESTHIGSVKLTNCPQKNEDSGFLQKHTWNLLPQVLKRNIRLADFQRSRRNLLMLETHVTTENTSQIQDCGCLPCALRFGCCFGATFATAFGLRPGASCCGHRLLRRARGLNRGFWMPGCF